MVRRGWGGAAWAGEDGRKWTTLSQPRGTWEEQEEMRSGAAATRCSADATGGGMGRSNNAVLASPAPALKLCDGLGRPKRSHAALAKTGGSLPRLRSRAQSQLAGGKAGRAAAASTCTLSHNGASSSGRLRERFSKARGAVKTRAARGSAGGPATPSPARPCFERMGRRGAPPAAVKNKSAPGEL